MITVDESVSNGLTMAVEDSAETMEDSNQNCRERKFREMISRERGIFKQIRNDFLKQIINTDIGVLCATFVIFLFL